MSVTLKIFVYVVIGQGAVMADQSDDKMENDAEGPSLLQVSQTPLPPVPASPDSTRMPARVRKGTLRGVCEMVLVVLAVVFWSQLKETVWPSVETKGTKAMQNAEDVVRGAVLHEAARNNDIEMIKKNAVPGDVDFRDNLDRTPLHVAAALGWLEATEQLLAFGANPSAQDFDDVTPCMLAGKRGHRDVVRILLDAGAVVGGRDTDLPPVVAQELMARLLK